MVPQLVSLDTAQLLVAELAMGHRRCHYPTVEVVFLVAGPGVGRHEMWCEGKRARRWYCSERSGLINHRAEDCSRRGRAPTEEGDGDYDGDGATTTTAIVRALREDRERWVDGLLKR